MNYNEIIPELKNIDYEEQMIVKISNLKGEQRAEFLAQCVDLGLEEKHFNDERLSILYGKALLDEDFSHLVDTDIDLVELRLKRWNDLGYLTNQNYLKNIVPELISLYERKQLMFKLGDIQDKILEEKDVSKLLGELESIYKKEREIELTLSEVLNMTTEEKGIKTGIKKFDLAGVYLSNGNIYSMGADTGMGKTTTAINIAVNQLEIGNNVLYFSIEQQQQDILLKFGAMLTELSEEKLIKKVKTENEKKEISQVSNYLQKHLTLIDRSDINSSQMLAIAKFKNRLTPYSLIIVDYWQLLALNENGESYMQKLIQSADMLLSMAKQLNVPVLVLGQINKSESRAGELDRNAFSGSKQLSNNSSYVFMIQKEEERDHKNKKIIKPYIEIVKSRKPNHLGEKQELLINRTSERLIN